MKKNDELALTELQKILLARCNNITVSARTITEFSIERVLTFSCSQKNAFLFRTRSSSPEISAFPQRSFSCSICVPVTHSVLGYFCPVLYCTCSVEVSWCTPFAESFRGHFFPWLRDFGPCKGWLFCSVTFLVNYCRQSCTCIQFPRLHCTNLQHRPYHNKFSLVKNFF